MKNVLFFLVIAMPVFTANAEELTVEVSNPLAAARSGEIIALDWNELSGGVSGLTKENARVVDPAGKAALSQAIDNDGDGGVDELLFMTDLLGGEAKSFKIAADSSLNIPESASRVYARFVPERADDFAWENDVIAYRAYGPALANGVENSGFDCFMKRVKYPVVDGWYKGEKLGKSYHLDYGEGYDGYKVGSSLGGGGTAIWSGGLRHMSNVYREWRQFSNGPLRASFVLSYGPWEVDGKRITETRRITLDLGSRMFEVREKFYVDGKPANPRVAVGLSTHEGKAKAFHDRSKGYLYCWEDIDGHPLGTGVVVPPGIIGDYKLVDSKKKFEGNAFYVVAPGADGEFTYFAGYGWEKAGEIVTREQWESYLESFIERQANPVAVKIVNGEKP
ncbi:MAG TPA: DUF4861 domain-containing protein [bacterium]|nr:DUF4861 domain-containing protein [bacterium]